MTEERKDLERRAKAAGVEFDDNTTDEQLRSQVEVAESEEDDAEA